MQLRRISEGATPSVQLNIGHGWIDVREILARLSPRVPEDKVANWSSNLVALLGAPPGLRADLAGSRTQAEPAPEEETTEEMLDTCTVAARLGYPDDTIRHLARTKGIGKKIGGRWQISIKRAKAALRLG